MSSILDGVRNTLNQLGHGKDNISLINEAYTQIKGNWNGNKTKSRKNWKLRFVPLPTDTGKHKRGHGSNAEVPLERAFASVFNEDKNLWNQMPVASGLVENSNKDRRRAMDLVYRPDTTIEAYEFIELKVATNKIDTPKDAAIEVIEYALLYLFSRQFMTTIGYSANNEDQPILGASLIGLRVLAEKAYYENWKDHIFLTSDELNNVISGFIAGLSEDLGELKMDFKFESFPSSFICPEINSPELDTNIKEALRKAFISKNTYIFKSC